MNASWLANEHHRLHSIEQWPEGPRKQAALTAARSTLDGLLQRVGSDASGFLCLVCGHRCGGLSIVGPTRLQHFHSSELAA
jgi:hypothetical protein